MNRVRLITHGGKNILFVDFSGCDLAELNLTIDQAKPVIQQFPRDSILFLSDLSNVAFSPEVIDAFKEFAKHNSPFVKSSAILGLTGIRAVAINSFQLHTGRIFRPFSELEKAKDWLASI
jgi:prepilin-type processing-associated H-X9-DG protein